MLAVHLKADGQAVNRQLVSELLGDAGYSLRGNRKSREGSDHPDRDEKFRYINRLVREFQAKEQPVISVDPKKKELVGDFKNARNQWWAKQSPDLVRVHNFLIPEKGTLRLNWDDYQEACMLKDTLLVLQVCKYLDDRHFRHLQTCVEWIV